MTVTSHQDDEANVEETKSLVDTFITFICKMLCEIISHAASVSGLFFAETLR